MTDDVSLVKLTSAATEWEAAMVVNRLQSAGIAASATGGFTAGFRAEAPGSVHVLVDSRDRAEALEVVQAIEQDHKDRVQAERMSPEASIFNRGGGKTSRLERVGWRSVGWLAVVSFVGSFLMLGFQPAVWIVCLALLIIGSAIWLRHRWTS